MKVQRVNLYLEQESYKALRKILIDEEISVSEWVRWQIINYIEYRKKMAKK